MKKVFITLCVALCIGCTQKNGKPEARLTEKALEMFDESEPITPIDTAAVHHRVSEIYDEVFALYNKDAAEGALAMFNDMFLSAGFRQLDSLLRADSQTTDSAMVYPDYDHWVQAQDWQDLAYTIDGIYTLPRSRAMVQMTISNMGQPETVQIVMVEEDGQWMIDDFVTEYSERQEMMEMRGEK